MLPSESNSVYSDFPTTVMNGLQFGFPKTSRVAPLPWPGVHVLYFFCLTFRGLQLWCIFLSVNAVSILPDVEAIEIDSTLP